MNEIGIKICDRYLETHSNYHPSNEVLVEKLYEGKIRYSTREISEGFIFLHFLLNVVCIVFVAQGNSFSLNAQRSQKIERP